MGDLAAAAERAGLDAAWAPELYDRSATISVAEMAHRTERCTVGTAIAYGVGRSPLTLAAEARDLDEISDGRFVLGHRQRHPPDDLRLARPGPGGAGGADRGAGAAAARPLAPARGAGRPRGPLLPPADQADRRR